MGYRIGLYLCLSAAFLCLFVWLKENSILSNAVKKTAVLLRGGSKNKIQGKPKASFSFTGKRRLSVQSGAAAAL